MMTVEGMAAIWLWFARQWKPEVNLPRPKMGVRILLGRMGTCSPGGLVTMSPWAGRRAVIHEYGHHLGYQGAEASPAGRGFLAYVGKSRFDNETRELWARSVVGLLTGRWRGGNRRAAEAAIGPLLRFGRA